VGYILRQEERDPGVQLKPITEVADPEPLFHESLVPFLEWISSYYLHPIGLVIQSVLPGGGDRPFRTASLTERGLSLLGELPARSRERELLEWIFTRPGKRLPWSPAEIRELEGKGLINVSVGGSGRRSGPRMQRFVRPSHKAALDQALAQRSKGRSTPNEAEFLAEVFRSGGLLLREVTRRYHNGSYLVRKWVEKGIVETYEAPVLHGPAGRVLFPSPEPPGLVEQQEKVLEAVREELYREGSLACLLHGVTGSGKTEVYFRTVREVVQAGRRALILVPEISLVAYMEGLFRSRMGDRVGVYHSALSRAERYEQWVRMARGEVDVVIGARSALFSPLPRLGLIVVDEEHDSSYKQEEAPRYQARDAAVVRGRLEGALVILGSGTPSVQSYHNAVTSRYRLLSMPERIEKRPLPSVEIIDMKDFSDPTGSQGMISPVLQEALEKNLKEGMQTLLFLNRRGYHRVLLCRRCGEVLRCPNCDLALIQHLSQGALACHYCGFRRQPGGGCSACGHPELRALGFGTERLEEELSRRLPGARVARMDRDSTRPKDSSSKLLKAFGEGRIDVLVGTQMITKGYDFPNVTLVGVIAADASLGFPDFRAAERTFQLLCQVAGRAGRGDHPGRVLVQTFNPGHYAVAAASTYDYSTFYQYEKELREQLGYPPFSYLARLRLKGNRAEAAAGAARRLARAMDEIIDGRHDLGAGLRVLGPVEAPIPRLRGKYRWQLLVKARGSRILHDFLREVRGASYKILKSSGVSMIIDVDPYQML
jgi:primosomal protein N' (replication factor Y)